MSSIKIKTGQLYRRKAYRYYSKLKSARRSKNSLRKLNEEEGSLLEYFSSEDSLSLFDLPLSKKDYPISFVFMDKKIHYSDCLLALDDEPIVYFQNGTYKNPDGWRGYRFLHKNKIIIIDSLDLVYFEPVG